MNTVLSRRGKARRLRARATSRVAVHVAAALLATSAIAAATSPDLVVSEVALKGTTVRVTVENRGDVDAGASVAALFASADPRIDDGDERVATLSVPPLGPGARASFGVTVPQPARHLIAVIDSTDSVPESDETNNLRSVLRDAADPMDAAGVLRVCARCQYPRFSDAAAAVADGQTILIEFSSATLVDCATIASNGVTVRGILNADGRRPVIGDKSCADKGVIVVPGAATRDLTVEGLEIVGARVPDGNGAAIRFQGTGLTVRNLFVHDNENGILASGGGPMRIEHSVFVRNGSAARPGRQHNVYFSGTAESSLDFTGNISVEATGEGHELKSRAGTNRVSCSVLASLAGRDSYTIDFPQAGEAFVERNVLQQGPNSSNTAMVSFGRESGLRDTRSLVFSRNVIVNDHPSGYFFAMGPGSQLSLDADALVGPGRVAWPASAVVRDTSTRYPSRAAYAAAANVTLPEWSESGKSLPDLPAECARLHPHDVASLSAYVRALTAARPAAPRNLGVR